MAEDRVCSFDELETVTAPDVRMLRNCEGIQCV